MRLIESHLLWVLRNSIRRWSSVYIFVAFVIRFAKPKAQLLSTRVNIQSFNSLNYRYKCLRLISNTNQIFLHQNSHIILIMSKLQTFSIGRRLILAYLNIVHCTSFYYSRTVSHKKNYDYIRLIFKIPSHSFGIWSWSLAPLEKRMTTQATNNHRIIMELFK